MWFQNLCSMKYNIHYIDGFSMSLFMVLLFFFWKNYCIFPLSFNSLIPPSPLPSPHCCPCLWDLFPFCSTPLLPNPSPHTSFHPALHLLVSILLGVYQREPKTLIWKNADGEQDVLHLHVHCVHCNVIYNHQVMDAAQVPISRWVDKTTKIFIQRNTTQS